MSKEEKIVEETTAPETQNEETTKEKKTKKDSKKDKINELEAQLEEVKTNLAKEKDDYLRLMAEFDNYRRRTSEEKLNLINTAAEDTIKGMLPILDDFERALKVINDSSDSDAAKEGIELMYTKLLSYLKSKGLDTIDIEDGIFNTDFHEAVAQFPVQEEDKKGKIFDIAQTGYTLNGKVIRYTKVVIGI